MTEGRHRPPLRLLASRARPAAGPLNGVIAHHQVRGLSRHQAHLPRRADQRRLLRAAAHRRPARHLPLRALPAAGLRLRRRGELAHHGVRCSRRWPRRSPTTSSPRPPAPAATSRSGGYDPLRERHYIMYFFSRRRLRRQRATATGSPTAARPSASPRRSRSRSSSSTIRCCSSEYALREGSGGRRPDARRLRRRLPHAPPARRGPALVPDGPRPLRPARPVRRPRRRDQRGGRDRQGGELRARRICRRTRTSAWWPATPSRCARRAAAATAIPGSASPALVARDVARGYITADDAARDYGVVVTAADPPVLDVQAPRRSGGEVVRGRDGRSSAAFDAPPHPVPLPLRGRGDRRG